MNATIQFQKANAGYSVLSWEPVHGSGERLNVGALIEFQGTIAARPLIREDVLRCMYGSAGDGAFQMILATLKAVEGVGRNFGFSAAREALPLASFCFSDVRETCASSEPDLFRQIVLMNFSLSILSDEPAASSDDSPTPEREVNQQWTTKVKDAIQARSPELVACFNQELVLVEGGAPVRFPILTPRLVAQFGLLKINQQNQGMEDARAKLWKLALARERKPGISAALVVGIPPLGDVTLGDRARERFISNMTELNREAKRREIDLRKAESASEAAELIIEIA